MNAQKSVLPAFSLLTILALLLSSVLVSVPVLAADMLVVTTTADSGAGSLRKAIADISPGGTIKFHPDLSGQAIMLDATLEINKNLTIDGSDLLDQVIISGAEAVRVFDVSDSVTNAILKDLTIIDGKQDIDSVESNGAGIRNYGHLTVINCTLFNHQSEYNGGGIYNQGTLVVENSIFVSNRAKYYGGGIHNEGQLSVSNSIFSGNGSGHGGGGLNNRGVASISSSSFFFNQANVFGGGIWNEQTLALTNSTISENYAGNFGGGGIFNDSDGVMSVLNTTLYRNESANDEGGISNKGSLKYINTIIANSTGEDCVNDGTIHADSTHNLVSDGSCHVATNLTGDPKLGPLANNGGPTLTHALLPNSPAIEAGSAAYCSDYDQRGVLRPQGAGCDIGAFEVETLVVTNASNDLIGSLRETIAFISPGGRITFSPALSGQTITLSSSLVIEKTLTIDGSALALPVTISGNNAVGVFVIGPAGVVTLESLKIINGSNEYGGGINNLGQLRVLNCTLDGNTGTEGGGAIFNSGDLFIFNSALSNNYAEYFGGGMFNQGTMIIDKSYLFRNETPYRGVGGGIYTTSILFVIDSTLSGNKSGGGGGIYNKLYLEINNSTFSGNEAYDGGGIYNLSNIQVYNSTFYGNSATADGGGIQNLDILSMVNSTLSGNTAKRGGGISNDGSLNLLHVTLLNNHAVQDEGGGGLKNFNEGTVNFISTIVAHSTKGDCVNHGTIHTDSTHNLVTDGSCGALLIEDPNLGPLADNGGLTLTHVLLPGSPAIDAGSNSHCIIIDQRGFPRPVDGNGDGVAVCDIGAVEYNPAFDGVTHIFLPLILR